MSYKRITAPTPDIFPDFRLKTEISTVFMEYENHVLVLQRCAKEDQSYTWGIPGGKAEREETPEQTLFREVMEETQIPRDSYLPTYLGKRFARIPGWDYIVHIYHAQVRDRICVEINPQEHSRYEWISIFAFKTLKLVLGQDEIFDTVYNERIWQRIHPSALSFPVAEKVNFILRKGDQFLFFHPGKRFVINLIGTSGSGKGTQGDMLSCIFGIPNISAGDLFRDEFRARSKLAEMIEHFDATHYPDYLPDEVPIGMMTKRLGDPDCRGGFILDGFPRTEPQGIATREVLLREKDFHVPLFMDVPEEDIWARLPGRFICPDCGHQVREFDENPTPGFCPVDSAKGKLVKLEHRIEDIDRPKIERRLRMFRDNKEGILSSISTRDEISTFPLTNETPPREVFHLLSLEIQNRLDVWYRSERIKKTAKRALFLASEEGN